MQTEGEKLIPVVESSAQANYPFVVERKNTENWNTSGSAVTLAGAQELARDIQAKCPGLPVRIEHCKGGMKVVTSVPVYKQKEATDERPYIKALW